VERLRDVLCPKYLTKLESILQENAGDESGDTPVFLVGGAVTYPDVMKCCVTTN